MRKLLNTLYVTSENSYLGLDGENVVVYDDKKEIGRVPLHNLEGIVSFGYRGTSPALMGACADKNISLCYLTPQGKFLARVTGKVKGNVILREQQFSSTKDEKISLGIAKTCILGKVYNARWVLERASRDHPMQIDVEAVKNASSQLKSFLEYIQNAKSMDQLRGYEGEAASIYFGVFDELILQQKKDFVFQGRNKRPPLDNVNAMLSFVYTLLTNQITSALETIGLDPYVGYMHTDRPVDVRTGVSFPSVLTDIKDGEAIMGFDYVIVGEGDAGVSVTVACHDENGKRLSGIDGIKVPLQRGRLTTVRGNFLTTRSSGNVQIDSSFDGKFDIEIK